VLEVAYSRAGHLIRRTYQISQALFLNETAELGLTSVQYSALNAIVQLPDLDQASLSGVIALDKTTLVKVLDRLVSKDLITRVRSTTDRRCHVLNPTAKGRKTIADILPMLDRIQERLLAPLAPDEQVVFLSLLSKIVQVNNIYSRVPLDHEVYDGVKQRAEANKAAATGASGRHPISG
jgi:MarR family transcriptional regulator, lower aerobic nicotinate degradation pathway regulator